MMLFYQLQLFIKPYSYDRENDIIHEDIDENQFFDFIKEEIV